MNERIAARPGKGFSLALRFICVFAAMHMLLCLLQVQFLPLEDSWNIVWLGTEIILALAALGLALGFFIYAQVRATPSREDFHALFSELKTPGFALLFVWVVWAYIACLLAIREGRASFYHNVRYLFYQTADMLVLFPLGLYFARRDDTALLRRLFDICLLLTAARLAFAFVSFFGGRVRFTAFFGHEFDFTGSRVMFGENSNQTGAYTAFFLAAGICRFPSIRKTAGRVLFAAAELIVFAAFVMAESRGALIGLAVTIAVWAGAAAWHRSKKSPALSVLIALVCAAAAAGVFLLAFYWLRGGLNALQRRILQSAAASAPGDAPAAVGAADAQLRDLLGASASNLGGRRKIWLAVVRNAFGDRHILLHGTTMANTSDWVATFMHRAFRTHNQLLEVLAAQGLPALALFLAWLVWLAGKSLALGLDRRCGTRWMLPLPLLTLIIHNMVEMMLVGRTHIVGCFFFLIAGAVAGFAPAKEKK
ncbi:MAG: O-antigen ligase family protein [Oscillospiraceae bacterium]|nr:O-antigen ligase family protein [Oscillospiraceae bacterium]